MRVSLRRGRANLLCVAPILTDDLIPEGSPENSLRLSIRARHPCAGAVLIPTGRRVCVSAARRVQKTASAVRCDAVLHRAFSTGHLNAMSM